MSKALVRIWGRKVYHRVIASWGGDDGKIRETACGVWGGPGRLRVYSPDSEEKLKPCRKCFPGEPSDELPT